MILRDVVRLSNDVHDLNIAKKLKNSKGLSAAVGNKGNKRLSLRRAWLKWR